MSYRIVTFLIFTLITSSILYEGVFAGTGQTYDAYIKESGTFCDDSTKPWGTNNTLVPKIDYPELNDSAINATIAKWRNSKREWMVGDEKNRLKEDLDPITIGEFRGFKALEVARIGYRSNMNALFACAVISSRINSMKTLQEIIDKKINNKESEIQKKFKKNVDSLTRTLNQLKCKNEKGVAIDENKTKEEMMTLVTNTATNQYCHYRFYLGYLDSNITTNLRNVQEIEKKIGKGSGTEIATNTNEWVQISPRYPRDLANEIVRADTTLPKAMATLKEMDYTYSAHILLELIYNDYIRLRKALSSYMNVSSQLYQKANNAQSTNKGK